MSAAEPQSHGTVTWFCSHGPFQPFRKGTSSKVGFTQLKYTDLSLHTNFLIAFLKTEAPSALIPLSTKNGRAFSVDHFLLIMCLFRVFTCFPSPEALSGSVPRVAHSLEPSLRRLAPSCLLLPLFLRREPQPFPFCAAAVPPRALY